MAFINGKNEKFFAKTTKVTHIGFISFENFEKNLKNCAEDKV